MAVRGEYLLAPRPGFVAGYDAVGVVEIVPDGVAHLHVGQRVAAVLPGMGAHARRVSVSPSLLVPIPDELESAAASTVALDALTAHFALAALGARAGSVLIQGAGGAVGSWATQLAIGRGLAVWGTASARSGGHAERLGARVLDYRDRSWIEQVGLPAPGGVGGAIDHTGDPVVRRAVRRDGRIVRIAFGGGSGRGRMATARGFVRSGLRRWARPGERVCSVPMLVRLHRHRYREALSELLSGVATGRLSTPAPRVFHPADYANALLTAESTPAGTKVVLAF